MLVPVLPPAGCSKTCPFGDDSGLGFSTLKMGITIASFVVLLEGNKAGMF